MQFDIVLHVVRVFRKFEYKFRKKIIVFLAVVTLYK